MRKDCVWFFAWIEEPAGQPHVTAGGEVSYVAAGY